MSDEKDRYDEMTGPQLGEELSRRELTVSGRVDELRARLREDDARRAENGDQGDADDPNPDPEGEDPETDDIEVPEPREPSVVEVVQVTLDEDQARALTAGEARMRQFLKHVNPIAEQKHCAGDQVLALETDVLQVLPFGVQIPRSSAERDFEQSNEG